VIQYSITPTIEEFRGAVGLLVTALKFEHPAYNDPQHKKVAFRCSTCMALKSAGER
jgi:hypothetical protein